MSDPTQNELKAHLKSYWEQEVCYTRYGESESRREFFRQIEQTRYTWEYYIPGFAGFDQAAGRRVLEIGVGAGTDFRQWVTRGARASGIDLTEAAIACTRENLEVHGIPADRYDLQRADAENLPFPDREFDLVYSWGVLHHSPDTKRAFQEVFRVLKPGGRVRAMVYHISSWTGWMLWVQHCLLKGRPDRSVRWAIYHHLQAHPKSYTLKEAHYFLAGIGFQQVKVETRLGAGDLLLIKPSKKYQHPIYKLAWALYPRPLVRWLGHRFGINLMMEGVKPEP